MEKRASLLSLPLIVRICNGNSQSKQKNEEGVQKSSQVAGFLLVDHSIGFPEYRRSGHRTLQSTSLVGWLSRYAILSLLFNIPTFDFLQYADLLCLTLHLTFPFKMPLLLGYAEITNMFFIALFSMEMMLKMYSLGFQVSFTADDVSQGKFLSIKTFLIRTGLLRLALQSVRLFRRDRLHHRDDPHEYSRDATARRFRSPLRPVAQGI